LHFFDGDHLGGGIYGFAEGGDIGDGNRVVANSHVGDDHGVVVAVIQCGLEHLDALLGVQGSPNSAD